ncbi:MAG: ABC transporter ATP-binding protein [Actinomycetota bacterium]
MGPRVAGVPGVVGVEVAGEVAPESRRATDRVGHIVVESLRKEFGATVAVNDLSFDVSSGSVTGFLGPNGAGKTTTLRVLLGLVSATRGRASIDGQPYRELAHPTRKVGAVLEGANFHPGRTARNHMRVVAGAGRLDRARIDEVLALVGLTEFAGKRVQGYSLGMKQRLGIAAALLGDPEVLILDEPANGLDPEGIRWLRGFLRALAAEGRTVLVSSHVLAEMSQTVDEVIVIGKGNLIAQAPLRELLGTSTGAVRVRTPDADRLESLLRGAGKTPQRVDVDALVVADATNEEVGVLSAREGIVLHELVNEALSLEDVFLKLTASAELGA